eukprot:COSAG01_NODE_858_length_13069_cov_23.641943_3_plen_98_part_00
MTQLMLWVKRYRAQHDDAPDRLCIVYDSENAFEAVSRDTEPAKNAAAAQVAQGVRRQLRSGQQKGALSLLSTQSFGRPGGVGFPGGLHAAWAAGDLG